MADAIIVGIDEAGRGPLAGPVVAGACVYGGSWCPEGTDIIIGDSKALTEKQREEAFIWITTNCPYGIGSASAQEIDAKGILAATEAAMHRALDMLKKIITPTYLLVDGRDKFWFDYPKSSIIGGDALEPAIAAASILAKVTRDRFMCEAAKDYPKFGFEQHKGYASPEHIEAIKRIGPSALHRKTFLRNIIPSSTVEATPKGAKRQAVSAM